MAEHAWWGWDFSEIYSSDAKIFFKYFNSRIVRSKDRKRQRMSNYRSLSNSFIASTKELSEAYTFIASKNICMLQVLLKILKQYKDLHLVHRPETQYMLNVGMANGKCETLRDGETSVFLCEPETFWLFRLRDRDFKVFYVRARDVQTLKIRAPDLVASYENELEWACTKVLQRSLLL